MQKQETKQSCPVQLCLERGALPDRGRERALVEIVELAADRDAVGEPRHLHGQVSQQFGDVMRRGLPLQRGVHRQHHFVDAARLAVFPCPAAAAGTLVAIQLLRQATTLRSDMDAVI